jgi:hypothetical protein
MLTLAIYTATIDTQNLFIVLVLLLYLPFSPSFYTSDRLLIL